MKFDFDTRKSDASTTKLHLLSNLKPLSANPTKWSNKLKQFVDNCSYPTTNNAIYRDSLSLTFGAEIGEDPLVNTISKKRKK